MHAGSLPATIFCFSRVWRIRSGSIFGTAKNKKYGGIKHMTYDIKATINGQIVHRVAHGDLQAWLIINQLARDGCKDICMSERKDSTAH